MQFVPAMLPATSFLPTQQVTYVTSSASNGNGAISGPSRVTATSSSMVVMNDNQNDQQHNATSELERTADSRMNAAAIASTIKGAMTTAATDTVPQQLILRSTGLGSLQRKTIYAFADIAAIHDNNGELYSTTDDGHATC
ncbi:unnamed protein product [Gongylonema pulchrum]|uniref:Uncharacterized protein n=1 Tax=Gongylonema pulchrum TaxID=637853 RepID=A0A3P7RBE0_9BILA|nr:unnamed protein product [Gongylonema pulchrum]